MSEVFICENHLCEVLIQWVYCINGLPAYIASHDKLPIPKPTPIPKSNPSLHITNVTIGNVYPALHTTCGAAKNQSTTPP